MSVAHTIANRKIDGEKAISAVGAQHDRRNPERAGIGNAARDPRPARRRGQRRRAERAHASTIAAARTCDAKTFDMKTGPLPTSASASARATAPAVSTDRRSAPATSVIHSQSTPMAARPQNTANSQPPT